jgi:Flp pilus assembly protein TadB
MTTQGRSGLRLLLVLMPVALVAALVFFGGRAAIAAEPPRLAVILFDTNNSPSSARLSAERVAVRQYARALPADVEVALITFGDTWRIALAPTRSRGRLDVAVAAVKFAGASSDGISGALARAAALIDRLGSPGHSRILILSNGEFLTKTVRSAAIPTDVVTWNYDGDDYPGAVRRLAFASGGQFAQPSQAASLAAAFPALAPASHPSRRSAVPSGAAQAASAWKLTSSLMLVLLVVFLVLTFLAFLAINSLRPGGRRPRLASQIGRYGPMGESSSGAVGQQAEGRLASGAVNLMTQVLNTGKSEPKLAQRLDQAGINRQPAEWALLGVCACAGLAALLTLLLRNVPLGIAAGVLVGWMATRLTLSVKISRRRAAFDAQLPNVLQLVGSSIQTGFSLAQAIDAVVREDTQPASGEFARALGEAQLGVDLADALEGVASRLDSRDLRWVVMAIRIQRETGGNLAEVLRNTVNTMRERAYLRRQVRSLSAEGRLSAWILLALPLLVGGWLFYSNPRYMHPLYTTVLGVTMLVIAFVLVVIGAFWMRSVINVEA